MQKLNIQATCSLLISPTLELKTEYILNGHNLNIIIIMCAFGGDVEMGKDGAAKFVWFVFNKVYSVSLQIVELCDTVISVLN